MHLREIILFFILIDCLSSTVRAVPRGKAIIRSLNENDVKNEWRSFKTKHSRLFRSTVSEQARLRVFKENIKKINEQNEKYNNGTSTYASDINSFSDMTTEEFMNYVKKGLNVNDFTEAMNSSTPHKRSIGLRASVPLSVDWRTKGYVNPIRNQGGCGSCWTFSAVSSLEGQYFKTNGKLLNFSEQQLVDCVYLSQGYTGADADGCDGGWMINAFNYIRRNGIALRANYPYTSGSSAVWSGSCKYSASNASAQVTGYVAVTNGVGNETAVTQALANVGPLSVAMYVTPSFQHYSSGVFTDTSCPVGRINHAVNLVGYGSLNGQDYYILRNSWGTSWGDKGYMLYRRNSNNQCAIASYASYPLVKATA